MPPPGFLISEPAMISAPASIVPVPQQIHRSNYDEADRLGADLADDGDNLFKVFNGKRCPCAVAARTLDEDQFRLLGRYLLFDTGKVVRVVLKGTSS